MQLIHIIEKELCNSQSSVGMLQWYKVAIFAKFINDHQDSVIMWDLGKPSMKSIQMTVQA
jgi:hypothetical protein